METEISISDDEGTVTSIAHPLVNPIGLGINRDPHKKIRFKPESGVAVNLIMCSFLFDFDWNLPNCRVLKL
ncbi:hypothetical protein Ciccas_009675, partial [Cichlidogyrus casuarinus]